VDGGRAGQLLRRFTLGCGPLKRVSDRVECLARVLVVCGVLAAVVTALIVGTSTHTQARAQAIAQAADRHPVLARLVEDAPERIREPWRGTDLELAEAVWTDAAGRPRRVYVAVAAGIEAGERVAIWVDRAGDRTTAPMSAGAVVNLAVGQGIGAGVLLSVIAFSAYGSVRLLLDRSRFRRWAADWAVIEPEWTGRGR
jgi:hypothetical protein